MRCIMDSWLDKDIDGLGNSLSLVGVSCINDDAAGQPLCGGRTDGHKIGNWGTTFVIDR